MSLQLTQFNMVQAGLQELGDLAHTFKDNLEARLKTPVLEDDINLWNTWLDSKTTQLYGGLNEDHRHRFKIDSHFDLSLIVNAPVSSDGSVAITQEIYTQSTGAEFIIISKKEIKGAEAEHYAVKADQYNALRKQWNAGKLTVAKLEKAGGFKLNQNLLPAEVNQHGGWQELAEDKKLLNDYVPEAEKRQCFSDNGRGMGFYVETDVKDYKARPWVVGNSSSRSNAFDRYGFRDFGHFLRVRDVSKDVAVGDAPKNITYAPQGILKYLDNNPIKDKSFAAGLLDRVNRFYQRKE